MVSVGLVVQLQVKPGKGAELEARLRATLPAIEAEEGTTAWFAVRLDATHYAVFDVFPDEASRQAHLEAGRPRVGALAELFAAPPTITQTDVIAAKLP